MAARAAPRPGKESAALHVFFLPPYHLAASLEVRWGEMVAGALQVVRLEPGLLVSALWLVERELPAGKRRRTRRPPLASSSPASRLQGGRGGVTARR